MHVPSATSRDKHGIRMALLALERSLGGMGLLAPSSTYHHFAVGMTGSKMSSSQPKTTLFLRDDLASVEKKSSVLSQEAKPLLKSTGAWEETLMSMSHTST